MCILFQDQIVCGRIYLRFRLESDRPVELICFWGERPQGEQAVIWFGLLDDPLDELFADPLPAPGREHIEVPDPAHTIFC